MRSVIVYRRSVTSFLCALGYHSGTWVNSPPDGPCVQRRMCRRCSDEDTRTVHDHQLPPDGRLLYVNQDDDCYVYGVCTRCHNIGGRFGPKHNWGDNQYRYDDDEGLMYAWQGCRHCPAIRERAAVPIEYRN